MTGPYDVAVAEPSGFGAFAGVGSLSLRISDSFVNLSNPANAKIRDGVATGVIRNDD